MYVCNANIGDIGFGTHSTSRGVYGAACAWVGALLDPKALYACDLIQTWTEAGVSIYNLARGEASPGRTDKRL
jgi:hypothetical protein